MPESDKQEKRKKLFKDFEITEYDIDLILKRELDEKQIHVQTKNISKDIKPSKNISDIEPKKEQKIKFNKIFSNNFERTDIDVSKLKYSNILKLIKLEENHLKILLEKQILKKRELIDKKNKIKNEEVLFSNEESKIDNFRTQHQKLKDKILLLEVYSNKSKQNKTEASTPFKELTKDFDSPLTNKKIKLEKQEEFVKIAEPNIIFNRAIVEKETSIDKEFEYKNEFKTIEIEKPNDLLLEKSNQEIPQQEIKREKITIKEIDTDNKSSETKRSKILIPENVHTKPKHSNKKILNIVIVTFIVIVGFLVAYILNIENSYNTSNFSSIFVEKSSSDNNKNNLIVSNKDNSAPQIEELNEDDANFYISADTEQAISNFNDTFSNIDNTNTISAITEENELSTIIIEEDSVEPEEVITISKTTTFKSRLARNSHRIHVDKPVGFYFVLGSFSTMKNALNYKNQFSSNKLIILNSNGIKVCAPAEGTDEELISRLHEIHEIGFANAWLLFNEGI